MDAVGKAGGRGDLSLSRCGHYYHVCSHKIGAIIRHKILGGPGYMAREYRRTKDTVTYQCACDHYASTRLSITPGTPWSRRGIAEVATCL